jgi:hypothetical protein
VSLVVDIGLVGTPGVWLWDVSGAVLTPEPSSDEGGAVVVVVADVGVLVALVPVAVVVAAVSVGLDASDEQPASD